MTELYDAAKAGDLERVILLVEQGADKNQVGKQFGRTVLIIAADNEHLDIIRYLVEQGADVEKVDDEGNTPLIYASDHGHLEAVQYLLEQGADRDKTASSDGFTPLHCAAQQGHLEITKLLMAYGADLNMRNNHGELPIDLTDNEEIKQAIRDEPRRRMDHGHKRATEQDRHPNAAASASAQQEEEEQSNKRPRFDDGTEAGEGKVAEEDENSEPSDEEDGN